MKKVLCVVNKLAGGGEAQRIWHELEKMRAQDPDNFTLVELQRSSLTECATHEFVFIAGGDGTVSTSLSALAGTNAKVGIIPLGVGNDMARELGVLPLYRQLPLAEYLSACMKLTFKELAIWELLPERGVPLLFCNYLSFGFDAAVALRFAKVRSRYNYFGSWFKRLLYAALGLHESFSGRLAALTVQSGASVIALKALRTLAFFNIASYMGLAKIDRSVSPFDCQLECVAIRSLLAYPQIVFGLPRISAVSELIASAENFKLSGLPLGAPMQLDGEGLVSNSTSYQIRLKSTVRVLVA